MPGVQAVLDRMRESPYHWGWVTYFAYVHVVGVVGMWYAAVYYVTPALIYDVWPVYQALGIYVVAFPEWTGLVVLWALVTSLYMVVVSFTVVYYFQCHLAITMSAHRYFAHRSYEAKRWFHYLNVTNFSAAFQGPILVWAARHLHHHAFTDQPGKDPHTPKDGFWHAHCLWVMKKTGLVPPPARYFVSYTKRPEQFAAGHWQSKYHWQLGILMAFVVPTFVGWLLGDALGGFLVGACTRLVFQYHFTWIVNSRGHRNHDVGGAVGSSASETGVVGVGLGAMTVGESNHEQHHEQPRHYRIGRLPGQIDPGARVIEVMAWLGVCYNLVGDKELGLTEARAEA